MSRPEEMRLMVKDLTRRCTEIEKAIKPMEAEAATLRSKLVSARANLERANKTLESATQAKSTAMDLLANQSGAQQALAEDGQQSPQEMYDSAEANIKRASANREKFTAEFQGLDARYQKVRETVEPMQKDLHFLVQKSEQVKIELQKSEAQCKLDLADLHKKRPSYTSILPPDVDLQVMPELEEFTIRINQGTQVPQNGCLIRTKPPLQLYTTGVTPCVTLSLMTEKGVLLVHFDSKIQGDSSEDAIQTEKLRIGAQLDQMMEAFCASTHVHPSAVRADIRGGNDGMSSRLISGALDAQLKKYDVETHIAVDALFNGDGQTVIVTPDKVRSHL